MPGRITDFLCCCRPRGNVEQADPERRSLHCPAGAVGAQQAERIRAYMDCQGIAPRDDVAVHWLAETYQSFPYLLDSRVESPQRRMDGKARVKFVTNDNRPEQLPMIQRIERPQGMVYVAWYPSCREQIDEFIAFLLNKKVRCVVILTSKAEMAREPKVFDPYFRKPWPGYGRMRCVPVAGGQPRAIGALQLRAWQWKFECLAWPVSMLHVDGWDDMTAPAADDLAELAQHVSRLVAGNVPLIHCRAGMGRTGTLVAAMELIDTNSSRSLREIVKDIRRQRSYQMINCKAQMAVLREIAQSHGKPI
jgi:hypothetical protein